MTGDAVGSLIPGAINFRDVGGLAAGASVTRNGVLYRSGNLAQLDDTGVIALGELGLRRIVDLRADDEVEHAPSRTEGLGIQTVRVPLFLGSVASFFAEDLSLSIMYQALVEDAAPGIVSVVRAVIGAQPVLVHCTVGKDRTGVSVAVALSAAGVDADAIVADYARTESFLPEWRNRAVVDRLRAIHPDAVHLVDLATRSPAPVMTELLERIRHDYGSAAHYLRSHGLTDDELTALTRVLVA